MLLSSALELTGPECILSPGDHTVIKRLQPFSCRKRLDYLGSQAFADIFSPCFIIRKKYMKEVYTNRPTEDYFAQFNTGSR